MRRVLWMLTGLFVLLLAACNKQNIEPAPTATVKPTETMAPAIATPTEEPTPTPEPGPVSYTTGLPFEGEYRPVIVSIENSPAARPQRGLQTADVVYEVPVEGSITRFICVFADNVPEEVMPVRSARVPFLYIQHEWDAIFMHFGGAGSGSGERHAPYSFYGHALYDDLKFDIDGLSGKWNDYYYRVSTADAPHNVMGNPLLAQQLYDYNPEPLHWKFDSGASYTGESVSEFALEMCSNDSDYISYRYDAQNDVYLRSMNGKPFLSAETEEQVSVKNIIVQYSTYKTSDDRKLWEMTGGGNADFYIGGQLIHGTWERKTEDDETVYYDGQGQQIVLRPGNTWIHISPQE